jgi:septum site-determining protein MinC
MAVATPAKNTPLLELKSASLTLVAVVLRSTDLTLLAHDLAEREALTPGLFDKDPAAIDLWRVREADGPIDFTAMLALLRSHNLVPVAARGGNAEQMAAAVAVGLAEAPDAPRSGTREPTVPMLTETVREVQLPPAPVLIVDKPLRSGQQVYARGGDVVVLSLVSHGAEVIADGHVHVYAPLRGRAIAGAKGNTAARIFSTCMQAELLAIAGVYRSGEAALPPELLGKAAQVRCSDDQLVVEALGC